MPVLKPIFQGTPKQQSLNISWADEDSDSIDDAILSINEGALEQAPMGPPGSIAANAAQAPDGGWGGARPKEPTESGVNKVGGTGKPGSIQGGSQEPVVTDKDNKGINDDTVGPVVGELESEEDGEEPGSMTYAAMASKNRWSTKQYKKRKRNVSSPKAVPLLKGIKHRPQREVLVQGIDIREYDCLEDAECSVAEHVKSRKIGVIFVKGLTMFQGQTDARIRVAVDAKDFETVRDDEFWPEHIYVREWYHKGRNKKGDKNGNQNNRQ